MNYAELAAATNFSFLHGASHADDMIAAAIACGHKGIGIADRNTVAGVVRAHIALRDARASLDGEGLPDIDFKLIVGARLVFDDGTPDVIAYPVNRTGWGRLCRLLTTGNLRAKKGECHLRFDDLIEWAGDIVLIVIPSFPGGFAPSHETVVPHARTPRREEDVIKQLSTLAPNSLWIGATMLRAGSDKRHLARLKALSARTRVPLIAVNDALYATPAQRPLHDIVTCIREG